MALSKKSHINIGKYLKNQREKAGLSQRQVAIELGYTTAQFVSNWERGLISPPMNTMVTLVDLYKMPKKELIELLVTEYRTTISEVFSKNR